MALQSAMFMVFVALCCDSVSASLRGTPARSLATFVPDQTKTANAFWSAAESGSESAVKARINDNWDAIKSAVADSGIADSKEFAMFIANIMQETGEMTVKTESTSHYTSESYDWADCADGVSVPVKGTDLKGTDNCKKHYFGRGYLQTTWHKNYKAIKDAGKCLTDSAGNAVDIVANPEKVATDEKLAWCTAAYYWKVAVHDDRCKNGCDMGNTISAINGDLECHDGNAEAQRRFCFYKNFYESYESTTIYWHDKVCLKDLDAKCPVGGGRLLASGSFTPDATKTAAAFWSAAESGTESAVKARITDNWSAISSAVADAGIADAKEFAMFIANIMQETGEMTTKTESTSHYTSKSYDWADCADGVSVPVKGKDLKDTDNCKKHYFGRGYLQTTWHKNYKAIKDAGKCLTDSAGNAVDIVANPEKVATDEKLAWCTAAYYWKVAVHDDRCKNGCDMGNTISAINGDLECKDGNKQAQRRFCFYKKFYESYADTTLYWHDKVCLTDLDAQCPVR